jgi:hypothetical protein
MRDESRDKVAHQPGEEERQQRDPRGKHEIPSRVRPQQLFPQKFRRISCDGRRFVMRVRLC